MKDEFVTIRGVPTHFKVFHVVGEQNVDKNEVILFIPGNPGSIPFYNKFLHNISGKTFLPVYAVGHAGHEIPKDRSPLPNLKSNGDLYGLHGQVEHKKEFIHKYLDEKAQIHFIGHSIGAYIIVQLLKDENIAKRVKSVNLLFPTIEHMAVTSNGKVLLGLRSFIKIILFLAFIFSCLPSFLQTILMYLYVKICDITESQMKTIINLINYKVLDKVFFMAYEEMDMVKEADYPVIKKHVDKFNFIYGENDGWAPLKYHEKLVAEIPLVNTKVVNVSHAFVLRHENSLVENLVITFINEHSS